MTPAVLQAKVASIPYQLHNYSHDPATSAYGEEAVNALGLPAARVFKTLLVALEEDPRRLVVALVPVSTLLDLKALAQASGARRCALANPAIAERSSGYKVGGISPLGQRKRLPTFIDQTACDWPTLFVSGGRRGLEIELACADLQRLTDARLLRLAR